MASDFDFDVRFSFLSYFDKEVKVVRFFLRGVFFLATQLILRPDSGQLSELPRRNFFPILI